MQINQNMTPIFENIPQSLKVLPQWCVWRYEERDGKRTKVPFNAATGSGAQSNNPQTWHSFDAASAAFDKSQSNCKPFDGLGFFVGNGCGIVGVDLDDCFDANGNLTPFARETVQELDSYTEITPSGRGLRIFLYGQLPPKGRKKGKIECYEAGRFLTVTGRNLGGTSPTIQRRESEIVEWHESVWGAPESSPAPAPPAIQSSPLSAAQLWEKIFESKNGSKIALLFAGVWEGAYPSQSEADSALCHHLAFWTRRDGGLMDAMFRESKLLRPKWDKAHSADGKTYGQTTIERAIAATTEVYEPHETPNVRFTSSAKRPAPTNEDQGEKPNSRAANRERKTARTANEKADEEAVNRGLYQNINGRILFSVAKVKETGSGSNLSAQGDWICDWVFKVVGEIHTEDGQTICQIEGQTHTGKPFSFEAPMKTVADARAFAALCQNIIGAGFVLYAGREKHLAPALFTFTDPKELKQTRSFARTGWTKENEFLIEGLLPPDCVLHLPRELAFAVRVPNESEAERTRDLLDGLFCAHNGDVSTLAVCHALLAPLAKRGGWGDEKFALFLTGRSGTFKTSFAQMVLSIFGDFGHDDRLLRFGNGGTTNALMTFPAMACDLPLLIDNFKPGTGGGQRDAQTLVHGLIEGTEKKRLNRDGTLRDSRELGAWMIFTGEDAVQDAASVARMLLVPVRYDDDSNGALSWVQANSHDLPLVGGAWLDWLASGGAEAFIAQAKTTWGQRRGVWVETLRKGNKDMVNALRVASSLALCECCWTIAQQHPILGAIFRKYHDVFAESLRDCALGMAHASAQSHEAIRFLDALRAMLDGGKAVLLDRFQDADKDEKRDVLGWQDEDFVFLNPALSFAATLRFLSNQNGLNGVGLPTISKQLEQLGYIQEKDGAHLAVKKRVGYEGRKRVFVFEREKFFGQTDDEESSQ